jgi:ubiquinone biosynthesis protein
MSNAAMRSQRSFVDRLVHGPVGFRHRLERLGPVFIKIGQFLALRPDLLPQEYCDELMYLTDRVPPFPWQQASAILKEDLKGEPGEIFSYINPNPVAAGSLAQTHLARLKDGTEVAVKIQRPDIRTQVFRDLKRARRLALLLELSGTSLIVSPREVVEELAEWLMQETDFDHELKNLTRLYNLTAEGNFQKIPKPFSEFSAARVLSSEYLRGVPVSELLQTLRSTDSNGNERVDRFGVDRDRLARNLIWSTLVQIFRHQFFHADLHPGNLMALSGDVIGFVDFGLCAELDESVRERQIQYISAFYSGDRDRMFKAVSDILIPSEETNMDSFRADFMAETSSYLSQARSDHHSQNDREVARNRSPITQGMVAMLRAARRNRLQVPSRVLSLYKALLTSETVARELGTNVDLRSVGREFFFELQREEALSAVEPDKLETSFLSMVTILRDSPGQLQQILNELSEGRFELNVNMSEAPKVRRVRNQRLRLLVTSILTVCVALLLVAPELPALLSARSRWPLWAVLIVLYLSIAFQWRRLK